MHLFFYFLLLAFLLLNVANKITNGSPLKAKLGTFVEEQIATSVESLWKGARNHENLRTTVLNTPTDLYILHTFCKEFPARISAAELQKTLMATSLGWFLRRAIFRNFKSNNWLIHQTKK